MWLRYVITDKIKDDLFVMDPLNLFPDPLGHMDTPLKTTASHNCHVFGLWTRQQENQTVNMNRQSADS